MIKPFWKSKTILFNVAAGLVMFFLKMETVGAAPELVAVGAAAVNVVLRAITKEPVGIKAG